MIYKNRKCSVPELILFCYVIVFTSYFGGKKLLNFFYIILNATLKYDKVYVNHPCQTPILYDISSKVDTLQTQYSQDDVMGFSKPAHTGHNQGHSHLLNVQSSWCHRVFPTHRSKWRSNRGSEYTVTDVRRSVNLQSRVEFTVKDVTEEFTVNHGIKINMNATHYIRSSCV